MSSSPLLPAESVAARPVLRAGILLTVFAVLASLTALFFALRPALPAAWSTAGSAELYVAGLTGAALVLVPFAFAVVKRSGMTASPPAWFIAHVLASTAGMCVLLVHSTLALDRAPALLLVVGWLLIIQGTWARTALPRQIAGVFATRHQAFETPLLLDRARMAALIADKQRILRDLDPLESEATFSLRPVHWLRHPLRSLRYQRLAGEERSLMGRDASVARTLVWWRRVHMALAWAFLLGIVVHVVTVTFFAGYVADGGPIHWWHVTAWGGEQ